MLGSMPGIRSTRSTMEVKSKDSTDRNLSYFDVGQGILQAGVFSDVDLFRHELESVFMHSWLFVAPEEWLSGAGAFVTSRMGAENVILWRGADGRLNIFGNVCVAGLKPLTSAVRGHADFLRCTCHGWKYDSRGTLLDFVDEKLEPLAQICCYKGLIFANRDRAAGSLLETFGEFAWYLDLLLASSDGGIQIYGEDAFRWTVAANWKVAAEAYCGVMPPPINADPPEGQELDIPGVGSCSDGFQVSTPAGVMAVLTPQPGSTRRSTSGAFGQPRDGFVPVVGTVFPNLSFDWRTPSIHIWHPIGPMETEIHSFCVVARNAPDDKKEEARRAFQFRYGPAGLESRNQMVTWSSVTSRSASRTALTLNLQMGLGRERSANIPGAIGSFTGESNSRAFFSWWQHQLLLRAQAEPQSRWLKLLPER